MVFNRCYTYFLISVVSFFLTCPSWAGTRLSEPLEDVLRRYSECWVLEAVVQTADYTWRESSDEACWTVKIVEVHRGAPGQATSTPLYFSAFRPAVGSDLENRSVYTTGSNLEFSLKPGDRFLFLGSAKNHVIRVEPVENLGTILELWSEK